MALLLLAGVEVLLLKVFDTDHHHYPLAKLTLYVDDGTVEAIGSPAAVVEAVTNATNCICEGMEEIGIAISKTKNVVIASSKEIGKAIEQGTSRWKVEAVSSTKMLGVGATAGVRRAAGALFARVKTFLRRQGNYGKLRRAGISVARALATGGHAVATYGIACHGMGTTSCCRSEGRRRG